MVLYRKEVRKLHTRKGDLRYMRNTYGWVAKVREVFRMVYLFICSLMKFLSLTGTLFLMPVFIGAILYFSLISFDLVKALVCCVALWVLVDCNSRM